MYDGDILPQESKFFALKNNSIFLKELKEKNVPGKEIEDVFDFQISFHFAKYYSFFETFSQTVESFFLLFDIISAKERDGSRYENMRDALPREKMWDKAEDESENSCLLTNFPLSAIDITYLFHCCVLT